MSVNKRNKKGSTRFVAKKFIHHALVTVVATKNNVLMHVADLQGNTVYWCTTRSIGFSGAKRTTAYAAQCAAQKLVTEIKARFDTKIISVKFKGHFLPREAALKSIYSNGMPIAWIQDITTFAHNGCRLAKRRRV